MNNYSNCPIELVVKLINIKWVIQIIRDLFFGKTHFSEFKEDKPELSNKVLSNCLKSMENDGIIQRISDRYEREVEYILTKKGQALNKIEEVIKLSMSLQFSVLMKTLVKLNLVKILKGS